MGDRIQVRGIRAYGYTGFFDAEQQLGQWFEVDLSFAVDLSPCGDSDELTDTLDYSQAVQVVQQTIRDEHPRTIERLAQLCCDRLLALPACTQVDLTLRKLHPPIPDFSGDVAVVMSRQC